MKYTSIYFYSFLFLIVFLSLLVFNSTIYCEGPVELPYIMKFGSAGIYAIQCLTTGALYIGSSVNLGITAIASIVYNVFYILISAVYYSLAWSPFMISLVAWSLENNDFPSVKEYSYLHLTETLKEARLELKGESGIYCLKNQITGAMYVGCAVNLYNRLLVNVTGHSSNKYLQNAIGKYGLENFSFVLVEFCDPDSLLMREQVYLDHLFGLPSSLRYNFSPTAVTCLGV